MNFENEIGVGLYAINNNSLPGLDYFYGQPFLAKDDDTAIEYVKEALKDKLDLVNLGHFQLVRLGTYNGSVECPIFLHEQIYYNLEFIFEVDENVNEEVLQSE